MESVSYIELFYNNCKQEWCAVSYVSTFFGDIPPHFKQEESPFLSSFAKPFRGSTVPAFPAIRCFPFPAVKHSPSCRQRKRSRASLGMTLREWRFPNIPVVRYVK